MNGHGHDAQAGRGEHHHRPLHAAQGGQKLRMTGIGETRPVIERLFVDRVGDDRSGLSRHRQRDGALDGADNGACIRLCGRAWRGGRGEGFPDYGQRIGENGGGVARRGDLSDRNAV